MSGGGNGAPEPRANPRLLGHERAERTLLEAIARDHLAHAWLFTGPRGIGKATLAFRLARHLLATGGGAETGGSSLLIAECARETGREAHSLAIAPDHPVARRVAVGSHGDLLTVERGFDEQRDRRREEIPVADIRRIAGFVATTPAEGGWRIVVIDEAGAMNRSASNALLKVLEEPPRRTLLILTSDRPALLPATVRSRCQRLALSPLADAVVDRLLEDYRPDVSVDARARLVAAAQGSIGLALSLVDDDAATLAQALGELLLGTSPDPATAVTLVATAGLGADLLLAVIAAVVRTRATGRIPPATGLLAFIDPALVTTLADRGGLDRWLALWDNARHMLAQIEPARLDRKQVFTVVLGQLRRRLG